LVRSFFSVLGGIVASDRVTVDPVTNKWVMAVGVPDFDLVCVCVVCGAK
jgi:hypothetical protein